MKTYKVARKYWRRFYKVHREGCEWVKSFIGGLSIVVMFLSIYFLGVIIGG